MLCVLLGVLEMSWVSESNGDAVHVAVYLAVR